MSEQPLPLAGYDELPLTTLRHRIRSLTSDELREVLNHEHAHGNRLPVVEVLRHRLEELEQGATPSPGAEHEPSDTPQHSRADSPVSPQGPREPGRPTPHGTRGPTGKGMEHD
ncbi:hypothetical protein [Parasphingorhabdus pacifica]